MKRVWTPGNLLAFLTFTLTANGFLWIREHLASLFAIVPLLLAAHLFVGVWQVKTKYTRLRICCHGGVMLCLFVAATAVSLVWQGALALWLIPQNWLDWLWSALFCIGLMALVFWNGMLSVYVASWQLGWHHRVVGALCGMIPVLNLILLRRIIRIVLDEVEVETARERLNDSRRGEALCRTKYPLLLVHGVFFRDTKYFSYWGRIPRDLKENGATVYYGQQPSAASVADCAAALTARIQAIVAETGCEKVNVIAHSKGGLDCRCAMATLDAAPYIASLTTVNTPHRGCLFADHLLDMVPESAKNRIAATYNATLRRLGEREADFLAAVEDLTAEACERTDKEWGVPEGVFCQSIGSQLKEASSGQFPLNLSYHLARHFSGPNDGLVSESSFAFGERYRLLTAKGDRGISHGDMIDLNRENIPGFDVREFYVELVHELKERGL